MTFDTHTATPYEQALRIWKNRKADRPQAVELMEQAAADGDLEARVQLAYWLIEEGNGAPTDSERAIELFTEAARLGHSNAALALVFHQAGLPVAQGDSDEAVEAALHAAQHANQAWDGKVVSNHEPMPDRDPSVAQSAAAEPAFTDGTILFEDDASLFAEPVERELVIDRETGSATWHDVASPEHEDELSEADTENSAVIRGVSRQPFQPWHGEPAPDLVRPNLAQIVEHIAKIVDAERGIMVNRLLRLYAKDLGMQRLKGPRKQVLISAVRSGVRARAFDQHLEQRPQHPDHWAIFSLDSDAPLLRSRGGRPTDQIPLREIAVVIRALQDKVGTLTHDELRDLVMRDWFALGQVKSIVRDRFDRALKEVALVAPQAVAVPADPQTIPVAEPVPPTSASQSSVDGWAKVAPGLRAAAESGDAIAQLAASQQLIDSPDDLERLRGERLLRSSAAQGEPLAAAALAEYIQRAYPESTEALTWAIRAADSGDIEAINTVLAAIGDPDSLDYQPNRATAYRALLAREQLDEDLKLLPTLLGALGALVVATRRLELRRRFFPVLGELAASWNWELGTRVVAAATARVAHEAEWLGSIRSLVEDAELVESPEAVVELAERLAAVGLQLIPDPRFDGITPKGHESVVIRQAPADAAEINHEYATGVALTHLALSVAAADGQVTDDELAVLRERVASTLNLTFRQADRLACVERHLLEGPPDVMEVIEMIADQLTAAARSSVGSFLVEIATADGLLHETEATLLTELFQRLGLDAALIAGAIRDSSSAPAREAGVERSAAARPSSEAEGENRDRLRRRFSAMAAQLGELHRLPSPASDERVSVDLTVSGSAIQLAGLDRRHEILVRELAAHDLWDRADAEDVAETVDLDLPQAVDVIRTWSSKLLGEPILELTDGQLEVRVDNIQELLAA